MLVRNLSARIGGRHAQSRHRGDPGRVARHAPLERRRHRARHCAPPAHQHPHVARRRHCSRQRMLHVVVVVVVVVVVGVAKSLFQVAPRSDALELDVQGLLTLSTARISAQNINITSEVCKYSCIVILNIRKNRCCWSTRRVMPRPTRRSVPLPPARPSRSPSHRHNSMDRMFVVVVVVVVVVFVA
jgi:hypothetical protein